MAFTHIEISACLLYDFASHKLFQCKQSLNIYVWILNFENFARKLNNYSMATLCIQTRYLYHTIQTNFFIFLLENPLNSITSKDRESHNFLWIHMASLLMTLTL